MVILESILHSEEELSTIGINIESHTKKFKRVTLMQAFNLSKQNNLRRRQRVHECT